MYALVTMSQAGHSCSTGGIENLQAIVGHEVATPAADDVERLPAKLVVEDPALVVGDAILRRLLNRGCRHRGSGRRLIVAHADSRTLRSGLMSQDAVSSRYTE